MRLRDYVILMLLSLAIWVPACQLFPEELLAPIDFVPTGPAGVDTCVELMPVDTPAFCNLYSDLGPHPPSFTYIYTKYDTMTWAPGETFSDSMEKFLTNIWPQFEFHVYGDQAERMSMVIIGSDEVEFWNRNIWYRNDFAHGGYGAVARGLYMQGLASYEEFDTLTRRLQSVQHINFIGPYTGDQRDRLARNALGDCKLGGTRADFRFVTPPVTQTIIDSFGLYMWLQVIQ